MKCLVVLVVVLACVTASTIPEVHSHFGDDKNHYVWMSNDDDEMVLVDLREKTDSLTPGTGADNEYWLYTRQNPTDHQLLVHGDYTSVQISNFNASKNTNFIVHGWTNNGNSRCNVVVRDAFLAAEDCNVIVVDWSKTASGEYVRAVLGVPSAGEYLGDFLKWFVDSGYAGWNQIHLVGYSLGAHVIGTAGRTAGGLPSRVTGLDAAGPLWRFHPNALDKTSGRYVEAIHTDGGLQGMLKPIAHADFYPNGGTIFQAGCDSSGCGHARSYEYFAMTVREDRYVAYPCEGLTNAVFRNCSGDNTLNMGNLHLTKQGSGIFGLNISEEEILTSGIL